MAPLMPSFPRCFVPAPGGVAGVRGREKALPSDAGLPRPAVASAQQAPPSLPARAARESRLRRCVRSDLGRVFLFTRPGVQSSKNLLVDFPAVGLDFPPSGQPSPAARVVHAGAILGDRFEKISCFP